MEVFFVVVEKEQLLLPPMKKLRARRINSAPLPCITSSFTPREEENENNFFFFFLCSSSSSLCNYLMRREPTGEKFDRLFGAATNVSLRDTSI